MSGKVLMLDVWIVRKCLLHSNALQVLVIKISQNCQNPHDARVRGGFPLLRTACSYQFDEKSRRSTVWNLINVDSNDLKYSRVKPHSSWILGIVIMKALSVIPESVQFSDATFLQHTQRMCSQGAMVSFELKVLISTHEQRKGGILHYAETWLTIQSQLTNPATACNWTHKLFFGAVEVDKK